MPYFDYLLAAFAEDSQSLIKSFGNHVHWGYWELPAQAKTSHEDFAAAAENLSQLIYKAAHVKNAQKILDVGCGFGGTIASLNQHYQEMELVGLNIDERQLIRARQHVTPTGTNTIHFQQGDACALPFADNSFDVVLAVECIFHFPSREQFFKEVYRVLKPGGYLALSDFLLRKKLAKLHNLKISQHLTNGFFGACNVQYNQEKYRQLAQTANLTVEVERNITQNTLPTYSYFRSFIREPKLHKTMGIMLTLVCTELLSRVHALEYFVFSFRKPL
jgi:ubiquinone/menaquinone biosynthesis C-methylase UbiE